MKKQIKPTWEQLEGRTIQRIANSPHDRVIFLDGDEYVVLQSDHDDVGCDEPPVIRQVEADLGSWMIDVGICTEDEFDELWRAARERALQRSRERELAELARLKKKYE